MSKGEIYKIDRKDNNRKNTYQVNKKDDLVSFIVGILVYATVLMIANSLLNSSFFN